MDEQHTSEWELFFDDAASPDFLLVRARGALDEAFYLNLFADLEAYMVATVGLRARYTPLVIDARACFPTREGLNALPHLIRRQSCRAGHVILWINQRGPNSPFLHSVALMLRAMLPNVHIIYRLDEAYGLLDIPLPARHAQPGLQTRISHLSF